VATPPHGMVTTHPHAAGNKVSVPGVSVVGGVAAGTGAGVAAEGSTAVAGSGAGLAGSMRDSIEASAANK
jgi:hypothetical protein